MKVVVIDIASNIAFDPGQVIPCHAVLLLGRKRSFSSCMVIIEKLGRGNDRQVSREDEGRCPAEEGTFVPSIRRYNALNCLGNED